MLGLIRLGYLGKVPKLQWAMHLATQDAHLLNHS
jgi:hypothetical protein